MIGAPGAKPPPQLTESVTVSLTPEEKARLAQKAKKRRTSMSALGRQAILKALGGS